MKVNSELKEWSEGTEVTIRIAAGNFGNPQRYASPKAASLLIITH
jgi:hypothetical protein